jgi:NAD(P)-dependent dehydrogenase (short-subunit alcohol dehydrogenase family)
VSAQPIALVTGANRGIGLEVARQLAARGFAVWLAARSREAGLRAAAGLRKAGAEVSVLELDVADPASVSNAAEAFGRAADHLDVLVNNAAICEDGQASVLAVDPARVQSAVAVNTLGPLRVAQAFWPFLVRAGSGRIINVSSGLGALGDMGDTAPAYSISKAALNAVTRQLAAALAGRGIAVNAVCPGWVRTEMGGPNAPRSVEEGADGIVWLATQAPQTLTGRFLRDRRVIPW